MPVLIQILIYAGSALMIWNIIRYAMFIRHVKSMDYTKNSFTVLYVPLTLLCLFFVGYLFVGIFGDPDFIVAGILFGGSVFVFLIMILIWKITDRIKQSEHLRSRLQAAEEASAAKSTFLSNMSHDIRTPLNAIIGYTNLAEQPDITLPELKEYVTKIGHSGEHLLGLINDILEMSRIESGKAELEDVGTNLIAVMDALRELFETQMKEKGLTYTVTTAPLENFAVRSDKTRLNRVLMNLISNAYKFTPAGGSVDVSLRQVKTAENGWAAYEFRVKDTGIGMSKDFAAKVFDAFERERTSTVSGIQGTGLGMAISKNIIDLMNGTIDVETEQGKGTEMIVRLPLKLCTEGVDPQTGEARCLQKPEYDFSKMRLLLAEDMEINREIALLLLGNMEFTVECAENGEEAVSKIAQSQPGYYDAVLMDIQMPVLDGYGAAEKIRRLSDPALAQIPILALTANAFNEDKQKALDAGMDGHVAKPIDPQKLADALHEALR